MRNPGGNNPAGPAVVGTGDIMKVSTTSSQTDDTTNASQSTVITVRLFGSSNSEFGAGRGDTAVRRTRSEPTAAAPASPAHFFHHRHQKPGQHQAQDNTDTSTLITDVIVIRHPRSVLILAVLELIIGLQILVIGFICVIYNGPVYASGVWAAWLFIGQGILGVLVVKKYPIRRLVAALLILTLICVILTLILFAITWHELRRQEERMRGDGWDFVGQATMELNKIVESTKAAVFIIQLVLLSAYASACVVTLILCIINIHQPSKELRRAFYIADDQFGHQLVLVPVKLRTGADMDAWLDEAAVAASSASLGAGAFHHYAAGGGGEGAGQFINPMATFPTSANRSNYYTGGTTMMNGSALRLSPVKSSKAVQTNVTFGE